MAIRKATNAEVTSELDKLEALKNRAARQAAVVQATPENIPVVQVRVLPIGDGKISMGVHVPGVGEAHYERGEQFSLIETVAIALEDRGFVEILPPEPEPAPKKSKAVEPDPEPVAVEVLDAGNEAG
jgi:hypothetical protein